MSDPEAQGQAQEPEQDEPVLIINGPEARKLYRMAKRANAYHGSSVGLLAAVADRLRIVHGLFLRAQEAGLATEQEVHLAKAFVTRLARRVHDLAVGPASAAQEIKSLLEDTLRQLDEADSGGYGLKSLQRRAEIDRRMLVRLQDSIKERVRESASVLAELEQAVDPHPGMSLAPAKQRSANAKIRKQQTQARRGPVVAKVWPKKAKIQNKKESTRVQFPPGITREQIASDPGSPEGITATQFLAALKPTK